MSNRYKPHLWILPEDELFVEIARGFLGHLYLKDIRVSIKVLDSARGWKNALKKIQKDEYLLRLFPERRLVVLMDFDQFENRREYADPFIPDDLKDRVYILGVENGEAEDFKKDCGMMSYEDIGMSLAKECNAEPNNGHPKVWSMERLQHNAAVIARLASDVRAKKIVCFHNDFTP